MAPTPFSRRRSSPERYTAEKAKGQTTDPIDDPKKHSILPYRSKSRGDRSPKYSSTTSEAGLAMSPSKTQSKIIPRGTAKLEWKDAPHTDATSTKGALPLLAGNKLDLSALPFEPVYRSGILIIITSPTGTHSLGLCDGEIKETERPKKRLQEWIF
jgi:hypothetical protein